MQGTAAFCAEQGTSPGSESSLAGALEEIVVTAQKRVESLSRTPVAVTALSADQRAKTGILTVVDLTNVIPGLAYNTAQDKVHIRGIGRQTNTVGTDPGVAVYTDGFYAPSTVAAAGSPLFIDRIEVLRGPQGTLYGRNSIGGAMNVIAAPATETFSTEARALFGNYGRRELRASISGPLSEHWRARLNLEDLYQDEGYYQNVSGARDEGGVLNNTYIEGILQGEIGRVDAFVRYGTLTRDERGRASATLGPYDTASVCCFSGLGPNPTYQYPVENPATGNSRLFNTNYSTSTQLRDHDLLVANLDIHFDAFDVRYVGGWHRYVFDQIQDLDGGAQVSYQYTPAGAPSPLTIGADWRRQYVEDRSYYSHEINLLSTQAGRTQWIVGVYFLHEDFSQPIKISANQPEIANPFTYTAPAAANPELNYYDSQAQQDSDSYAIFGQIDYDVTDTIRITGGARWSEDKKDASEHLRGVFYDPRLGPGVGWYCTSPTNCMGVAYQYANSGRTFRNLWSAWSGTAGVEWKPDDRNLTYLRYSRGFKSGGYNIGGLAPVPEVDSETLDALELGYKYKAGSNFWINTALFNYRYDDMQVPLLVLPPGGGAARTDLVNLDSIEALGFEVEMNWRPIGAFNLFASYAWLDSEIERACCYVNPLDRGATNPNARPVGAAVNGAFAQDVSGNALQVSAEHKVAITPTYEFDVGTGNLLLAATYAWRSSLDFGIFDDGLARAPSFSQLDLRATYTARSDRFSLVGYVRNATDEEGFESISASQTTTGLSSTYYLTPPRTYGVEIQVRY
ncbi:MAG TPA: TonB-dependent receptor [Steroidobacter sp.]|uniref:TonB-dependent receptor n=1 Tax=Steroidobacter sp. TaxID=1978227 RepID=UPI002EDB3A04